MTPQRSWRNARRLLVVRTDNIGDVIMAGPAIRAIRRALPHVHLTLLVSPAGAQAAALLPWHDAVIEWRVLWQDIGGRVAEPAAEWALVRTLEAGGFDGAVILTSFSQSPHPAAFVAWLAGIPLRAGASRERGALLTDAPPSGPVEMHQVERNLALVRSIGFRSADDALEIRLPREACRRAEALLAARGIAPRRPYLLVNPFASAAARTYPAARMARAVRRIAEGAGLPVVLTGHVRDRDASREIAARVGRAAIDLCGETSVAELAALVGRARLVLTSHTSVMHLADALRVPAITVFAGTDLVSQWQPRHGPHRLLRRAVACSPCYALRCPLDHACLDIAPEAVAEAALEQLGLGAEA